MNYFEEQLKTAIPWTEEMVTSALEKNPNRKDASTLHTRVGERMVFYILNLGATEYSMSHLSFQKLWESEIEDFLKNHEFTDYAGNGTPRFKEILPMAA